MPVAGSGVRHVLVIGASISRVAFLCCLLAVGCSGDGGTATDAAPRDGEAPSARYLPLSTAARWTYRVSDPVSGVTATKTSVVEALEDVGGDKAGVVAYRIRTEKLDGTTVSWQEDTGTRIVRHREQELDLAGALVADETYAPSKLRIDEEPAHLVVGASWVDSYSETRVEAGVRTTTAKAEMWTVEAVSEGVDVPAGTFSCLRLRRVGAGVGADKTYWFAAGVGKVKEAGRQVEELTAYAPPQ